MNPAIVVIAFNRANSLNRLLKSIERAKYNSSNIELIISIDFADSNSDVQKIANDFIWTYGNKRVITHDFNLGLKSHVLKCGDLVNEFDAIIMLEDDLTVSENFYVYSCDALSYYSDSDNIGGISLYNHKLNFINKRPFIPFVDDNDVYFLQIASSWGQVWTKNQWLAFREWYNNKEKISTIDIHTKIKNWNDSSWLKWFIAFLSDTNKYFVYPTISFTTNWSDFGTNNKRVDNDFQVEMELSKSKYSFTRLSDSVNIYDSYFELLPKCLNKLTSKFISYDYSINLYGLKNNIKSEYVFTLQEIKDPIFSFGLNLKPILFNIVNENAGNDIYFGKAKSASLAKTDYSKIDLFSYFYGPIGRKTKFRNTFYELIKTLK